ncbi:uncharacterized protein NECHADRAFT_46417, partial [Fusarium vanettenii 77-13-4]
SLYCINFSQLAMIVGAGAYARDLAAVVGGSSNITWMVQSITIVTSALGPPFSQAADYWGRKWFLVLSTVCGMIGCIIISRAASMGMAIGGSVICGLSYGSQPLLVAVASEIVPRRYRAVVQSGLGIATATGAIFGLLREKLLRLDWVAYAFLASGIVLFSMALTWADNPYSWRDARVSATFAISCVLLLSLGFHQIKLKKDGMIHHRLFSSVHSNIFSVTFFAAIVSSFGVAIYSSLMKSIRAPLALSFVLYILFGVLMATAKLSSNIAVTWCYPVILGIGFALTLTTVVTAAQMSAPPELIGLTLSLRSLGGSVALAIYNAIFNSAMKKYLAPSIAGAVVPLGVDPDDLPQLIQGLTTQDQKLLASIPGMTPRIMQAAVHALKEAYLSSFRRVWIALAAMAFCAFIPACFAINPKKDFSKDIDAPLDEKMAEATVAQVE